MFRLHRRVQLVLEKLETMNGAMSMDALALRIYPADRLFDSLTFLSIAAGGERPVLRE